MTEAKKEQIRQAKVARLAQLKSDYRKLQVGATPAEKAALVAESAILQKRLEVASRRPLGVAR